MANPEDLGRYRLKRLLGRGRLGEVWEAKDLELEGHRVAVKILHAADDELTTARLQFAREARIASHLHHPNLVRVRDSGEAAGTSFMVMEMVEGKKLRRFIGDASVTLDEKLRWIRQIGDALAALHRADLVHRDLKPENVLIRPDRSACVVDLGMYKWIKFELGGERDPADIEGASEDEGPDPTYAPPEAIEVETYDELGDQWAWGVLAYELLTSKRPDPDSPPLASLDAVPKHIADAIDRARSANRDQRWDSLEIALDEVGRGSLPALASEPASRPTTVPPPPSGAPPETQPVPSLGPPRALSPMVIGIGILLILGIVIAAVASLR